MNRPKNDKDQPDVLKFDPNHKMNKKAREKLLSDALKTLSSCKIHNWHFVVVANAEQRKRIREVAWGQAQVTDASMLIILCTDIRAWEHMSLPFWHSTRDLFRESVTGSFHPAYALLDQTQRDELMRSCGVASQTLMLTAQAMDFDACVLNGFDAEEVGDLINLPDDHAVCMLVAIGKYVGGTRPVGQSSPVEEIVINEHF